MQHFFGERARIPIEFPGVSQIVRPPAVVTIQASLMSAEKRFLRMFRILQPRPSPEAHMEFGQQPRQLHGPQAEIGNRSPYGPRNAGSQVLQNGG